MKKHVRCTRFSFVVVVVVSLTPERNRWFNDVLLHIDLMYIACDKCIKQNDTYTHFRF